MPGKNPKSPPPDFHAETGPPAPQDWGRSIDFELTDFDSARGALEEPPAGVRSIPAAPPDWPALRRMPDPQDAKMRTATLAWLRTLDPSLRPRELAARFPRIANQIAEGWADPKDCLRLLGALLMDHRGGRRGFPPGVAGELHLLLDHTHARSRLRR